ncbi:MAG: hypothetical protein KDC28_13215 [Saprospiraceae bacterium]|nr:hypothetical protein [Saprospiraceae bacterium]MCB9321259.1 hypothetical protein [Lewinellaceae bacterium]
MVEISPETLDWLLTGDPVILHWVHRDLMHSQPATIEQARRAIAREGWGKALLDSQDPSDTWGHGLYSPKWTSTFYTCLLLKRFDLPPVPAVLHGLEILLESNKALDGGWGPQKTWNPSDTCVNGMLLSMLAYWEIQPRFQKSLVDHLLQVTMKDGGWNCRLHKGAHHSSFHSTLSVLEGLSTFQLRQKQPDIHIDRVIRAGITFMLEHKLYQSHRTGEIVDPKMTRLSFPTRWRYDILKMLDYFQWINAPHDERMEPAIELLNLKKDIQGRWPLQQNHAGRVFFHLEKVGQPSRINTVRALRVLQWWNA